MISHKSLKLIVEDKNSEIRRIRNDLHNTKLELDHYERERREIFDMFFGRPINAIHVKGNGIVDVRTKAGETLTFKVELVGETIQ